MTVAALLDRLQSVRQTGPGRWVARCPAHEDKKPSLAIRELDDGRVLLHDFAGCDVYSILAATGLEFSDLYPERPLGDWAKRERRAFNALDVLRCVGFEALLCATAAANIQNGVSLTPADHERFVIAASRLQRAVELANV